MNYSKKGWCFMLLVWSHIWTETEQKILGKFDLGAWTGPELNSPEVKGVSKALRWCSMQTMPFQEGVYVSRGTQEWKEDEGRRGRERWCTKGIEGGVYLRDGYLVTSRLSKSHFASQPKGSFLLISSVTSQSDLQLWTYHCCSEKSVSVVHYSN